MKQKRTVLLGLCICAATVGLGACAHERSDDNRQGLPDPLAAGWQGKPVCEQLELTASQRVLRCTFAPGVGHERHYHAPHFGYALAGGRMRLTDAHGVRDVDLASGSYFSSGGTEWHEVLNIGETTVQYLIIEPLQNP